jgi:hypothetical protein
MRHILTFATARIIAGSLLIAGIAGCCAMPRIPEIHIDPPEIHIPTLEIGDLQDETIEIPLDGADAAQVEITLGAGELDLEAGASDNLFSGRFVYNVDVWQPTVNQEDGELRIRQGGDEDNWGVPSGGRARNEWELEFSPEIPLDMALTIGAGDGELDFSDLRIRDLRMEAGAGDFYVTFGTPNEIEMPACTIRSGAARLELRQVGNASPARMAVQGGAGNTKLDLTGAWRASSEIDVVSGVGQLTILVPADTGARVRIKGGMTDVEATGLEKQGDAYVNSTYGEGEIDLDITLTTGIGSVRLEQVETSGE